MDDLLLEQTSENNNTDVSDDFDTILADSNSAEQINDSDTSDVSHEENSKSEEGGKSDEQKKDTTTGTDKDNEQVFAIKHNGQSHELPYSEMVMYAQKGFDYDRVRSSYDEMKSTLFSLFDNQVTDVKEVLSQLSQTKMQSDINTMANELIENDGLDDDVALRIATLEYKRNHATEKAVDTQSEQEKEQQEQHNTLVANFSKLMEKYPEVSGGFDKLPTDVAQAINDGEVPIIAYQEYLIKEKDKQIKKQNDAEKNKNKAVGSPKGEQAPASDIDVFYSNF